MWSDQAYYYSDSSFQLELNLQSIRRILIQTLDDFEAEDCQRCCLIKCRCQQAGPTPLRSANSSAQESEGEHKAPPATDLPRPDFKTSSESNGTTGKDVENWVRASTPNPEKNESKASKSVPHVKQVKYFWPPANSVWNDYKTKINRPEINTATVSQATNVQEFFKSFNLNMYCVGSKYAYSQHRALMQQLKFMAGQQPEYTYF